MATELLQNGVSTDSSGNIKISTQNGAVVTERIEIANSNGNILIGGGADDTVNKVQVTGPLIATVLKSSVATGTAPLSVTSTTVVPNLNADTVDGAHLSTDSTLGGASPSDAKIASEKAVKTFFDQNSSGGGVKNYIAKPNFEQGTTTGWSLSKDSGTTIPTSGGTGGANANMSPLSVDTTTPLAGTSSMVITKTTGGSSQGSTVISDDITIDREATISPLTMTLTYRITGTGYTSGDMSVFLWDITNNALIPASASSLDATNGQIAKFYASLLPSSSLSYRWIFMWTTATVPGTNIVITVDSIALSPQSSIVGPAVSGWKSYTPNTPALFTGVGSITGRYKRYGDEGKFKIRVVFNATPTGNLWFNDTELLGPLGLTFATIGADGNQAGEGTWWVARLGSNSASGAISFDAANKKIILAYPSGSGVTPTNPFNLVSGDVIEFTFMCPISQWSVNVNMATEATEYASNSSATDANDTTSFVSGMDGSVGVIKTTNLTATRLKRVRFSRPILPNDLIVIEVLGANGQWGDINTVEAWSTGLCFSAKVDAADRIGGVAYRRVTGSQTDLDIIFNQYALTGGTGQIAWNNGAILITKWRVRKVSNGNMAEQPPVVRVDAYRNTAWSVPSGSYVLFIADVETEDTHSCYNTSTGVFTAPLPGVYLFSFQSQTGSQTLPTNCYVWPTLSKNDVFVAGGNFVNGSGVVAYSGITLNATVRCKTGDTLKLSLNSNNTTVTMASGFGATNVTITRLGS